MSLNQISNQNNFQNKMLNKNDNDSINYLKIKEIFNNITSKQIVNKQKIIEYYELILNFILKESKEKNINFSYLQQIILMLYNIISKTDYKYNFYIFEENLNNFELILVYLIIINKIEKQNFLYLNKFLSFEYKFQFLNFKIIAQIFNSLKLLKKNIKKEFLIVLIKILYLLESFIPDKFKYFKIIIYNSFDSLFHYFSLYELNYEFINNIIKNSFNLLNIDEKFTKSCISQIINLARNNPIIMYNFILFYIEKFNQLRSFKIHINNLILIGIDFIEISNVNKIYNKILNNIKYFKKKTILKVGCKYYSNNLINYEILNNKQTFSINICLIIIECTKNKNLFLLEKSFKLLDKIDLISINKNDILKIIDLFILYNLKIGKEININKWFNFLQPKLNFNDIKIGMNWYFKTIFYNVNLLKLSNNPFINMLEIIKLLDEFYTFLKTFNEFDLLNKKESKFMKYFNKNNMTQNNSINKILNFIIQFVLILKNNKLIFILNYLFYLNNKDNKIRQLNSLLNMRNSLKKLNLIIYKYIEKIIINWIQNFDKELYENNINNFLIILKIYNKFFDSINNKENLKKEIIEIYLKYLGNKTIYFNLLTIEIIIFLNNYIKNDIYNALIIKETIYYLKIILNSFTEINKLNIKNIFEYHNNDLLNLNFYFIDYIFRMGKFIISQSIKLKLNNLAYNLLIKLIEFYKRYNLIYYILYFELILIFEFNDYQFNYLYKLNIFKNDDDILTDNIINMIKFENSLKLILLKLKIIHHNKKFEEKKLIILEDINFLKYKCINYGYKYFFKLSLINNINKIKLNKNICNIYDILFNNDYNLINYEYILSINLDFLIIDNNLLLFIFKIFVNNFFNNLYKINKEVDKIIFLDFSLKLFIILGYKFLEIYNYKKLDFCIIFCVNIIYLIDKNKYYLINKNQLNIHNCDICETKDIDYYKLLIELIFKVQNINIKIRENLLELSKTQTYNNKRISLSNNDKLDNLSKNSLFLKLIKENKIKYIKNNDENKINKNIFLMKFIKQINNTKEYFIIYVNINRIYIEKNNNLKNLVLDYHKLIKNNEISLKSEVNEIEKWYNERENFNKEIKNKINELNNEKILINILKIENKNLKNEFNVFFENLVNTILKKLKINKYKKLIINNFLLNDIEFIFNCIILNNNEMAYNKLIKNDLFKYYYSSNQLLELLEEIKLIIKNEHKNIIASYSYWIIDYDLYLIPLEKFPLFLNSKFIIIRKLISKKTNYKIKLNLKNNYYLVNTEGDLKETEERLKPLFNKKKYFEGKFGIKPNEDEINFILKNNYNLFYMGHGCLNDVIKDSHLKNINNKTNNFIFLMGCRSINLINLEKYVNEIKNLNFEGIAIDYLLSDYKIFLGNLWTVTDNDCDRITIDFIKNIEFGKDYLVLNLNKNLLNSIKKAKLYYTNGIALTHLIF